MEYPFLRHGLLSLGQSYRTTPTPFGSKNFTRAVSQLTDSIISSSKLEISLLTRPVHNLIDCRILPERIRKRSLVTFALQTQLGKLSSF